MLDNVKKIIYVYSGKGGVGKSTVCANLAFSLMRQGLSIGIFDADISSPSIPSMVSGLEFSDAKMKNMVIVPSRYENMYISSAGFLSEPIEGSFWVGKYLKGALYQLLYGIDWKVDILLIDMPPGTSDLHQELFTKIEGDILFITTPQIISYVDVIRSIDFVKRLNISIIGVVDNMAYLKCLKCNEIMRLYNGNTKSELCEKMNIDYLMELEMKPEISQYAFKGIPFVEYVEDDELKWKYNKLTKIVLERSHSRC